ncbi:MULTISPECIES: substrate-binding domain-containing protein [Caballeronia]|jgi:ribose transport system substrate-binding protein|uniref:ABC transporter substrate-binding protein n=1 Tax=Caballeronia zhejiangensis TaxID=871203 RepID=A0A656QF92_9BURK|nr:MULTISPECIES: substrate-binding domain-containing protein [Caballeronia]EKS67207.1 sugar ABC transporter substrate-binding protein [Burkholderia sp. SJ98]KDR27686.1 ABC transporter substrate-binding protein [Caballeronia zhejiangensis]MDR5769263.1 substrate-binding domain-containing protein [Caballeronia sp. LZ028]MDR5789511.1 substrate-binding domain-containing protein [Caballeronia sp. LP003]
MKKMLRALGALTLTASAFAAASSSAFAADKVVLGVAIPTADHGFTGGIVWWANEAKKELEKAHPDLKVIVKTASTAPEQANQLQDLVTVNKINALVIFPQESASLTQPVAQVKKKGVYVTVVDRGLTDTSAQDAYVAGDNTAFGKIPAEFLAKQLNGKGDIVALRGIPTTLDNERWNAFEGVLKQYPDIKILDAKYANWNRDDAFKVMQDYLTRFKHIDAVWAADDDMMVGVLKAIDQAKRTDIKIVFGGAGSKEAVKRIMDGDARVPADVSYSPKFIYDAIKLTAEARLKGDKLPPTTIIPSVLITKDNAKQFYFPNSPF